MQRSVVLQSFSKTGWDAKMNFFTNYLLFFDIVGSQSPQPPTLICSLAPCVTRLTACCYFALYTQPMH
jgi:hypothetical protein